ncbi:MAG: hypothetical protein IPM16_06880 [Chloroflexi bacterium]|nr:hypothetical protein [Chloroflexota bacterium]
MSSISSIRFRVEQRIHAARCSWTLVSHQMAGRNPVAGIVLRHIIDVMDERRQSEVHISNEDWQRQYGFGRTRVRNAIGLLAAAGVRNTNDGISSWRIDDPVFWPAFETALQLCAPDDEGPDGGVRNEHPPVRNEHPSVRDEQAGTGSDVDGDARNVHLIQREREKGVLELFSRFRLVFGGKFEAIRDRLLAAAARLTDSIVRTVLARCRRAGGRTWSYVAVALETEANSGDFGRQLALIPAVEVPAPKPATTDLRETGAAAPAASWTPPAPMRAGPTPPPAASARDIDAWNTALHQLRLQMPGSPWLEGARLHRTEGDEFVVNVGSPAAREMLQHRLYRNVARVLSDACGRPVRVLFESPDVAPTPAFYRVREA